MLCGDRSAACALLETHNASDLTPTQLSSAEPRRNGNVKNHQRRRHYLVKILQLGIMTDRRVLAGRLVSGCIARLLNTFRDIVISSVLDLQGFMPILHAWNLSLW